MKLLITGGSGIIGYKLVNFFSAQNTVFYTYSSNSTGDKNSTYMDVRDRNASIKLIGKIKPDIVIHCSAITNMDLCERDKALAKAININGTQNVVDGCKKTGSKMVYISTSAVFDGRKNIYKENDKTSPINYYGLTKREGEIITMDSGLPYLILRTDLPYCWTEKWQRKTCIEKMLDKFHVNENIKEVSDWYNTPTYVPNFTEVMARLLDKNKTGIYHLAGPDFINRVEMAFMVARIFKADSKLISAINSAELNLDAKRGCSKLDNTKAQKISGLKLIGLLEGLEKMKINAH